MKAKAVISSALLSFIFLFTATIHAATPVTLLTDEMNKLKFVNFENWNDVNTDNIINAGDSFEGIVNIESITNISGSRDLSNQFAPGVKELTGYFQFSVIGGSIPAGSSGHVDFGLNEGDFFDFYVGTGATADWDPGAADAITRASNGVLWASITGNTGFGYEGLNDTQLFGQSVNRNWADFDVNNTGYTVVKQLYSAIVGEPPAHFIDTNNNGVYDPGTDTLHNTNHNVDIYFASRLFDNSTNPDPDVAANWQFRSEDPAYISVVPEPISSTLFIVGGTFLAGRRYFRRKK